MPKRSDGAVRRLGARSGHRVLFCLDDGPRVLDCIEFDDELRYGDVVADVAFLAMDLERVGASDAGGRFAIAIDTSGSPEDALAVATHAVTRAARADETTLAPGSGPSTLAPESTVHLYRGMSSHGFRALSPDECRRRLEHGGSASRGVRGRPPHLPRVVRIRRERLVFRVGPGSLLASAALQTIVAFEADRFDDQTRDGWSVLVVGRGEMITDGVELDTARRLPLEPWSSSDDDCFIRVSADVVSGRGVAMTASQSAELIRHD